MEKLKQENKNSSLIKHALVLEDNFLCQKIMACYLQRLGYRVTVIDDAIHAMQLIQRRPYHLIIIDIGLARTSGRAVIGATRASQLNADTPLIIWSAFVDKNNEEKYLTWGADGALIKACTIAELKHVINVISQKNKGKNFIF